MHKPNSDPDDFSAFEESIEDEEFDRVLLAFKFVRLCNENMGYRGWPTMEGVEIETQELHGTQEGAFRCACQLLGSFFSDGIKNKEGGICGEEAQTGQRAKDLRDADETRGKIQGLHGEDKGEAEAL